LVTCDKLEEKWEWRNYKNYLTKFKDIDECEQNETMVFYRNKMKTEVYKWSKCAAGLSSCVNRAGTFECKCNQGYEGDGFVCVDKNECERSENKCPSNSICVNLPGLYDCKCEPGYRNLSKGCVGNRLQKKAKNWEV
jgi:hypothetical protein